MQCQKSLREVFLKDTLVTSKLVDYSTSLPIHLEHGPQKVGLSSGALEEKEDIMLENLSLETALNLLNQTNQLLRQEKLSVMQESLQDPKKTTCKDRSISCEKDTLHTNLSRTLDLVLTTKEKVLKPFWNKLVEENSNKLWLPTRTDCVDSDSSSYSSSFNSLPMLKSWFSNKLTLPQNKSLLKTSLILPQRLPPELMEGESTKRKQNKEEAQRSLKLRIFQTPKQKVLINRWLGAFRYSANRTLDMIDIMTQKFQEPEKPDDRIPTGKCFAKFCSGKNKGKICDKNTSSKSTSKLYCGKHLKQENSNFKLKKKKFTFPTVRAELLRHELETKIADNTFSYSYTPKFPKRKIIEREADGYCTAIMKNDSVCGKKCAEYSEEYCYRHARLEKTSLEKSKPVWLENLEVPAEIWKGACKLVVNNFNSSISNVGNNFSMKYKTKKDPHQCLMIGQWIGMDNPMYSEFGQIKGCCKVGKKIYNAQTLFKLLKANNEQRGFSLNVDQRTNKTYLLLPVGYNFLRDLDSETQAPNLKKIIAFDPGVRCFLTGFSGNHIWEFGKGANLLIFRNLVKANFLKARIARKIKPRCRKKYQQKMLKLNLKVKHMVTDMQWKLVKFITSNYEHIFLPPFEVAPMLRSRDLSRETKIQLTGLSFYKFKQKLKYRVVNSDQTNHLYTPTEEYTTLTCTRCGSLKTLKENNGTIVYCTSCRIRVPRDFAGARNYYLKSLYGSIA